MRAFLFRGGTSKGLFFRAADLPPRLRALVPAAVAKKSGVSDDTKPLDNFIATAMGSDRYGMQLDGVGGGISSTSKVAIVEKSSRPLHDVDYVFGQVDMKTGRVDWSGSCGNLASAVGLFALEEGLAGRRPAAEEGLVDINGKIPPGEDPHALVKIFQANLQYSIHVTVPHETAAQDQTITIPGVEAPGRPIAVNFLRPRVGNLPLLPTGNVRDVLQLGPEVCRRAGVPSSTVEASLVCAANPTIFVRAADLTLHNNPFPLHADAAHLQPVIDEIRRQGARQMGLPLTDAVRVSWLAPPQPYTTTAGAEVGPGEVDLRGCVTTPGRLYHHAFTGTGAINLACLAAIPHSIAHSLAPRSSSCASAPLGMAPAQPGGTSQAQVRLGQPAGLMTVQALCRWAGAGAAGGGEHKYAGEWVAEQAGFIRTARLLFSGHVHV